MAANNFVDSRDFARIARAIRYIEAHFREQPRSPISHRMRGCPNFISIVCSGAGGCYSQTVPGVRDGQCGERALLTQPSVLDAAYSVACRDRAACTISSSPSMR